MTFSVVIYETGSGRITGVASATGPLPPQAQEGESEVGGEARAAGTEYLDYVLAGVVTPRPALPVGVAGLTVTVPVGTEFEVLGPATASGAASDGVLQFDFAEPGTYTVKLRLFPYLDAEVTLVG